ncbi:MAG: site-specific integrase, partial [Lachnospiraceae bacterium]|nr:site-specific integrase [Lachnospiraceae bacterium]
MDEERKVTQEGIDKYMEHLKEEEKARNTMDKYNRDLKKLLDWLVGRPLTKVLAAEWKNSLQKANYTATSVNSMLSAANGFFKWMGWDDLKLDHLKIQRKTFCDENRELGRDDYNKLVTAAMFLQK